MALKRYIAGQVKPVVEIEFPALVARVEALEKKMATKAIVKAVKDIQTPAPKKPVKKK